MADTSTKSTNNENVTKTCESPGVTDSVVIKSVKSNVNDSKDKSNESKDMKQIICDTGKKTTPVVSALSDNENNNKKLLASQTTPTVSALDNSSKNNNRVYYRKPKVQNDQKTVNNRNKDSKHNGHVQTTRFVPPQKFKNRSNRRNDDDVTSRCSTPSSTTSTLSGPDLDDRDLMPTCKTVAEGGEGLPLMQVRYEFQLPDVWLF